MFVFTRETSTNRIRDGKMAVTMIVFVKMPRKACTSVQKSEFINVHSNLQSSWWALVLRLQDQ